MKKSSTSNKKERGQSLMELAISLLILLMLLTGAVETSLALFQFVTIRDGAQEGATYGSINPADEDGIKWRVMDTASDVVLVDIDKITVDINGNACEGSTIVDGEPVPNSISITVTFDHPITYPFVSAMIGQNTIPLTATVTNTILQPTCSP